MWLPVNNLLLWTSPDSDRAVCLNGGIYLSAPSAPLLIEVLPGFLALFLEREDRPVLLTKEADPQVWETN